VVYSVAVDTWRAISGYAERNSRAWEFHRMRNPVFVIYNIINNISDNIKILRMSLTRCKHVTANNVFAPTSVARCHFYF
jgi:hypothetical protein